MVSVSAGQARGRPDPSSFFATGRYTVEVSPPLDNFPSDDAVADLTRVNALLEAQVRKAPEQYWWVHRRFKTRPEGAPEFYGADARYR